MARVQLDGMAIDGWDAFHDQCAAAFGFPEFYGRNMDAWIDCMTASDAPEEGMTTMHGSPSDPVVLQLDHADAVPKEIFDALVECAAFVNWRRLDVAEPAILMLSFHRGTRTAPPGG